MRIVSFNVNGIRARPHQLEALRDKYDPDVIGLQETKVQDADFPVQMVEELGYQVSYYGQKGHYGVALLSKQAPESVELGLPSDGDDGQRRLIAGNFSGARLYNGYFPQGESRDHPTKFPHKQRFYAELNTLLSARADSLATTVVMGDLNIAPLDIDIGIGADNAKRWLKSGKTSFLPEERQWYAKLAALGLHDSYRLVHPDRDDEFSWFDYRSRGFERDPKRGLRIDLILVGDALRDKVSDAGIAYDIRSMEKPSDHCPIWVDLDL